MNNKNHFSNHKRYEIGEINFKEPFINKMEKLISVKSLNKTLIQDILISPLFINSFNAILVLNGTATININHVPYMIEKNEVVLFSKSHLINFIDISSNFNAEFLMVSRQFMLLTDSKDMIYKRIKYGTKLFNLPCLKLSKTERDIILKRMIDLKDVLKNVSHLYYKDMILNSLSAFYLDMSNIIDTKFYNILDKDDNINENEDNRLSSIVKSFLDLLITNYHKEHKVNFYANKLNYSTHYLTIIIKKMTGQTPADFIAEILYSDGRQLLETSKLSIQEIALKLNFADQSSFGKFFKRQNGLTPKDFRKKQ